MKKAIIIILLATTGQASAQIPVELFVGHEMATVDILFLNILKTDRMKIQVGFFSIETEPVWTTE